MAASVQSPADVVNLAARRIGYKLRVGSLYDGSALAMAALDIYAQTRDETLRGFDWGFAERNVAGTLLKQAPPGGYNPATGWSSAYPPLPYFFEYAYPGDCLKVRSVRPTPILIPNFDPRPNLVREYNDSSLNPPQKVILCNVPQAIIVYTGQVTDMTTWEADFVEALAAALGRRLAPGLLNAEAAKSAAQDEAASTALAESREG